MATHPMDADGPMHGLRVPLDDKKDRSTRERQLRRATTEKVAKTFTETFIICVPFTNFILMSSEEFQRHRGGPMVSKFIGTRHEPFPFKTCPGVYRKRKSTPLGRLSGIEILQDTTYSISLT